MGVDVPTVMGASLRPFFTYFGGKWRIAPRYPEPAYDTIVEPFAGSAGYSLRHPDRNIVLYDLDERVIGTWQYLIASTPSEIMRLPLYDPLIWETVDDLTWLPEEARWLIGWWLNKGTRSPSKSPSKWMRIGPLGENYWGPGVRARLARQVGRIRHWTAVHDTYLNAPDLEATWFVDPPYEIAGAYRVREVDFGHLGQWCRGRRGQVMVCENAGATWLPFRPFVDAKATHGSARAGVSKEAIWTAS